jgi:hypothetical protein
MQTLSFKHNSQEPIAGQERQSDHRRGCIRQP